MTGALLVAAAAAALLYYVTVPLRRGDNRETLEEPVEVSEATARKKTTLVALLELEDERDTGKLSEQDYDGLRRQYEGEAVEALRELDAVRPPAADDDDLEADIERIKRTLR